MAAPSVLHAQVSTSPSQPRESAGSARASPETTTQCKSRADPDLKALQTSPGSVAEPPSDAKVGAGKAASGLRFPPRLQLHPGRGARSRWEATAPRPPESADNLEITRRHPPGREVGGGCCSRLIRKSNPCFLLTLPPCPPPEMLKELPLPGSARRPADGSDNTSGTAGQKADYPLSPCPKHPFNFTKPAAGKAPLILRIFCKLPDLQPAPLRPSPEGPRGISSGASGRAGCSSVLLPLIDPLTGQDVKDQHIYLQTYVCLKILQGRAHLSLL